MSITPEFKLHLLKLKTSFSYFAKNVLKIRNKEGDIIPFEFNSAQLYLHDKLEHQLKTKGRIRAIVIKGRQMGISTYTEARFYHRLWGTEKQLTAFILTHQEKSTNALFNLTKGFHSNSDKVYQPQLDLSNAKQLVFNHNKCSYELATAGSTEVGRGITINLFHGSEVAFWANGDNHIASSGQAVGGKGSEIILESTANGVGNLFYNLTMEAVDGKGDYEVIFLPWFIHEEYETSYMQEDIKNGVKDPLPEVVPEKWLEYAKLYRLSFEKLRWAFAKNRELAIATGSNVDEPCGKFKQEYPGNLLEAFQTSGKAFIPAEHIMKARKDKEATAAGPVILGVDPARIGDKVGIMDRQGRVCGSRICQRLDPEGDLNYVANQVAIAIDKHRPDFVNIDVGGNGSGVFDILAARGYGRLLNAVDFGSKALGRGPTGGALYANRRSEMYDTLRDWFVGATGPVRIPDDDSLQRELSVIEVGPGKTDYNISGQLVIESKESLKTKLKGTSPDLADALALTFAVPMAYLMFGSNLNNASGNKPTRGY